MKEVLNKMNFKNIIKRFFLFFIVLLFLEFFYKFIVFKKIEMESFLNLLLLSSILSSILSIITGIFKSKVNNIIISIILFIMGLLFSIQIVFYNTFKTFFSLSILGLGDQLESFMKETIDAIIDNIFYIIIFFMPFIIYLISRKKINLLKNKSGSICIYLIILFTSLFLFTFHMFLTKNRENSTYSLYFNV